MWHRLIHNCLDFILQPLKKAAEMGIMMSDLLGSLHYVYTPLTAYIVDTQEAVVLAGVAGKTSHLTMTTYKEFGDAFRHLPCTASMTLRQLTEIEEIADPWDLNTYIKQPWSIVSMVYIAHFGMIGHFQTLLNSSPQSHFTIGIRYFGIMVYSRCWPC